MYLKQCLKFLYCNLLKLFYKSKKVRFLMGSYFENTRFEGLNSIGEKSKIVACNIGLGSYTGKNVDFNRVKVGRFCSIASNVRNIVGRHPTNTFVSTHPAFFSKGKASGFTFTDKQLFDEFFLMDGYFVEIGNDVWIGENVLIMDGVKIGNGAIVGANALVNKNIDPYSINVGTPSKCIGYRFNKENVEFLEAFQWWDKDITWISKYYEFFSDIEIFKSQFIDREK